MDGFSAREASRLAGFEKPWMLNHLERELIFVPEKERRGGHGKHRLYTFRDVIVLRAINRLLKLGARPKRIKDSIATFLNVCPIKEGSDELLSFARQAGLFIVTQQKVIYCQANQLVDLAKNGQLAFSFMVDSCVEIGPAIEAGLYLLDRARSGVPRNKRLLEQAAQRFGL